MGNIILDTNMYYYIATNPNKQKIFENYLNRNKYIHQANTVAITELINASETDRDSTKRTTAKEGLKYIKNNCSRDLV